MKTQSVEKLLGIRGLLVDLDGVIYVGNKAVAGLPMFLDFLERRRIRVLYITNNSVSTEEALIEKMAQFGLEIGEEQILTSVGATLAYLEETLPGGCPLYIIGEKGLRDPAEAAGYQIAEQDVAAVIVGLDRGINYLKIERAASEVLRGAKFIACNIDSGAPSEQGIKPGAGAMAAAIQAVTGIAPVVIGKPEPRIFFEGIRRLALDADACAAIGDRIDVDIVCAKRAGILGILVLSGMTNGVNWNGLQVQPDLIFRDIGALASAWDRILEIS